jgi:hypothetical protein
VKKLTSLWFGMLVSFVCFWRDSPQWVRAPSFTRFLDHTHNDAPQSAGLLWTSDQLVVKTHNTHNKQKTSTTPVGLETTISAGERPQTYELYRAATGIGLVTFGGINLGFGFRFGWRPPRSLGVFHEIKKKRTPHLETTSVLLSCPCDLVLDSTICRFP